MPQFTSRWSIPFLTIIERPSIHGITGQIAAAAEQALTTVNTLAQSALDRANSVGSDVTRNANYPSARRQTASGGVLVAQGGGGVGEIELRTSAWNDRQGMSDISRFPTRVFAPAARPGYYVAEAVVPWPSVPSVVASDRRKSQLVAYPASGAASNVTPIQDDLVTDVAPVVQHLNSGPIFLEGGGSVALMVGHNRAGGLTLPAGPAGVFLSLRFLHPVP